MLAVAAFFGLRLLGPAQMSGAFNLAVAEFGQAGPNGQISSSAKGQLISLRLFEGLKIELDSLSPADRANFQPQVWQDSLDITQKRVKIGIIPGDTPAARWTAACDLARQIHANVIIYGNLPPEASQAGFMPEFAICDNSNLRVDVDEIVGAHQLIHGLPAALLSQIGTPGTDLALNMRINSWNHALALFSIGVMYDLEGRSDLALGIFKQARDELKNGNAPSGEMLWFFIGREELILAARTAQDAAISQARLDHLSSAQAAFEEALRQNPAYARAHIGLGSGFFNRVLDTPPAGRLATPDLAATLREYQLALSQAAGSPGALIDTKARLGLASAWILQGEAQRDLGQVSEAGASFEQAIQAAAGSIDPLKAANQYRVLAQAYLSLGEAYHQQGHLQLTLGDSAAARAFFEKASQSYASCIVQKDAAFTDQTLADKIVSGLCVPNKKIVDTALLDLEGPSK